MLSVKSWDNLEMLGYRRLERKDIMIAGMSIFSLMDYVRIQQESKDLRTMQAPR